MSRAYSDLAFTPTVRAMQTRMGSRSAYEALDHTDDRRDTLTARESEFIHARDGFYQATVGETGWPYVQFRGGPAGFLKVLDAKTLGYADFRGNVQYISVGNLQGNDRVSIILMDYAHQRRLKILGRVKLVTADEDPALLERLALPEYEARVERAMLITVEAYDWNCPKHITPRFTEAEVNEAVAPLRDELRKARRALARHSGAMPVEPPELQLGKGPLALRISGVRQLTPRVRAYELRSLDGAELPAVQAGSHLDMPVRLVNGTLSSRRYSIASNPQRRDAYEIAVLRENAGSGGSAAVHDSYQLGMVLHCSLPGNDFALDPDSDAPAVLVAGGIGITPIKAMAQALRSAGRAFELHYAVRSRREGAYLDRLEREFGAQMHSYAADRDARLDPQGLVQAARPGTHFYVCGPQGLVNAVREAARRAGVPAEQVHSEAFQAAPSAAPQRPLSVTLPRRGQRIEVSAGQSILEALEQAGVEVPSGCRGGSCGQCAVKVLEGQPEHRDSVLSEAERTQARRMCICVSRAAGDHLTLDL
ncbi:2Fe-2S iron-sulfur cluster binding domain-containing protein [Mitsuaria sp. WAJ17]|uniref:2Fe-2S iron-sulfur cluster-binding protein n=1 Tax=Mitsuaria sp. WAJ17 TaxID=2761452 RepID=UPI0016020352|nr:2Fe-2S iron-sulfur cluster-binding protein [Mitsuaria sp. WAJ17]MBB2487512.1 2Fe-2S iron-sulfur cluster binding domain-containing protein [Mitsuaria sp. WAJ17]